MMKPIGVLYATREGHTWRVAEDLRARGFDTEFKNPRNHDASAIHLSYSAVVLAASVHVGNHEQNGKWSNS